MALTARASGARELRCKLIYLSTLRFRHSSKPVYREIVPYAFFASHFGFSWTMKLLVTPSKLVLLTGLSLLGICVVIAIIILLLHLKEKVS